MRRSRIVLLLAVMGLLLLAGPVSAAPPIHRAAVIVDTGTTVKRVCVRFTEESISGKDALDRANVDAVYRPFGGTLGSAVCSLCGVGRRYADCLGGGGSSDYWVYWRAVGGATSYTRSSFGVSSTRVRDGDVEGWRWGTSGPPPFAVLAEVCGTEESPSTTAAPPAAAPGRPEQETTSPPPTTVPGAPRPVPTAGSALTVATTSTSTSTAPSSGSDTRPNAGGLAATKRVSDDKGSGPGASLLGFGALLAALVGLIVRAGHRRRRPNGESG